MNSPAKALNGLLDSFRHDGPEVSMFSHQIGILNRSTEAALVRPEAVAAFEKVAADMKPTERAQFAFALSRRLPDDAPLQDTLCDTYAKVAEKLSWMGAYGLLNEAHSLVQVGQPMHKVVVRQLERLRDTSPDKGSEACVKIVLRNTPRLPRHGA